RGSAKELVLEDFYVFGKLRIGSEQIEARVTGTCRPPRKNLCDATSRVSPLGSDLVCPELIYSGFASRGGTVRRGDSICRGMVNADVKSEARTRAHSKAVRAKFHESMIGFRVSF